MSHSDTPQAPPASVAAWIAQDPARRIWRSDGLIIWNRDIDHGVQVFLPSLTPEELATPEALHAGLVRRIIATSESMARHYRAEAEAYLSRAARHDAICADMRGYAQPG